MNSRNISFHNYIDFFTFWLPNSRLKKRTYIIISLNSNNSRCQTYTNGTFDSLVIDEKNGEVMMIAEENSDGDNFEPARLYEEWNTYMVEESAFVIVKSRSFFDLSPTFNVF